MDKIIKQVIKQNKIIRYIPTFVKCLEDYKKLLLADKESNQVEAQVSDDFGGQPLKLTGEELNTLIDLLEIFYDDHYDKLHTKLMNKKYEIVNNISQNSR